MELLDPTLRELENADGFLGSLNNHYVREIYPQFKDDLKNLGIADIDVYENYNLQNVLDDLRHIQFLLSGSPRKDQFQKKVEFLVQLSQKTLKNAKQIPNEPKESVNKKLEFGLKDDAHLMKENKDKEKVKKEKITQLPPLIVKTFENKSKETKNKDEVIKLQKVSPRRNKEVHKEKKEVLKDKKELKKKRSFLDTKPLDQINEEETSDPESPIQNLKTEVDIGWNLSLEQHEMVQNTLKKYDMSEDVWRNYILTKIHGDAQLRRMGIAVPEQKVDTQIETIRFVEELERHMSRKARNTARKANSVVLKPLQADIVTKPPEFKHNDLFDNPLTEDVSLTISQSLRPRTLTSFDQPLLKKLVPSTTAAVTNLSSNQEGSSQNLTNMPTNLPAGLPLFRSKVFGSKTWTMGTLSSQILSSQPSQIGNEDGFGGPLDLNDSLKESLQMDHVSFYNYIKSQAQYRLNSLSSSNSHTKKYSHIQGLDTIVSKRPVSGRKYKNLKGHSLNSLPDEDDSLQGDSLVVVNGPSNGKNQFRISNVRTIRSKYLSSCNEGHYDDGSHRQNINNENELRRCDTHESKEIRIENDDLRSDLTSESGSLASGSLNDRTIQSTSIKSLVTICSQNESTRFGLSQVGKIDNVSEIQYCGKVKRICLLGSGSEAKVFLCRVKEYDHDVALKQYDLVKNQKGNVDTYESLSKEFEMLKHLKHENIIQYYCLYKPQKMTYTNCLEFGIIMEYMPGGSLDTYIEENIRTISLESKKSIMKQIISGLDFLHQHNIIHRDLKPGNILLSTDKQRVKISDFGISKKTNNDTNTRRTLVGTPWYMAPEVINQEGYSSKADIWSVGCCFFHLITGEKPYSKANAIQALLLMVNHKSPLEACSPEILAKINEYEGIKDFLELCFNRNQFQRPTAAMLLQHPIFKETPMA